MEKKLTDSGQTPKNGVFRDDKPLKFRPHNFLCAFNFQGAGYSKKFVSNFNTIKAKLNGPDGDQQPIHVVTHSDDICGPCPHKRDMACVTETKVKHLDDAHSQVFGFYPGKIIIWSEFKQMVHERLTIEKFNRICQDCEWKASGICESVLRTSGIK